MTSPTTTKTPTSPEDWLPILAGRMDAERPRARLLSRYTNGDAPLPEMSPNVRQSWIRFQKQSRTNWGGLICGAVADRIIPNGIIVGGDPKSAAARQAQRIWRDNRMDAVFKNWVRLGLAQSKSYLTCWRSDDGKSVITADGPDTMYASTEPLQPWKVRAAMRWWTDWDAEMQYAMVWAQNSWAKFERSMYVDAYLAVQGAGRSVWTNAAGSWDSTTDGGSYGWSDSPPVVIYRNPNDTGEFEEHIDLINRCNSTTLQILAISAMQAFRQRGIKGGMLPQKDDQGNDIDYTRMFEAAPGALWNLPEGLDIWESQSTDVRPLLDELKDWVRHLAANTHTPVSILIPDNANQSAQGAQDAKEGLVFKSADRLVEAAHGAEVALVKALGVEETNLADDQTLELLFEPVALVTLAEKYAAAKNAKEAGESWRSIARNILGYSPEQIEQDAMDRADEVLQQMSTAQQFAALTGQQQPQRQLAGPQESGGGPEPAQGRNGQRALTGGR